MYGQISSPRRVLIHWYTNCTFSVVLWHTQTKHVNLTACVDTFANTIYILRGVLTHLQATMSILGRVLTHWQNDCQLYDVF